MKILLVDSSGLIYRGHYGYGKEVLTTSTGPQTHAVRSFVQSVWNLQDTYQPDQTIVVFDAGKPAHRMDALPEYKANRKTKDPALLDQMRICYQMAPELGFNRMATKGQEADDLIWTICARKTPDCEILIVTEDKDIGQCLRDGISLVKRSGDRAKPWKTVSAAEFEESFGCAPTQVPGYLALVGDSSDNIPGVHGVGPKTAAAWIREHGTLDKVLENIETLKPERFRALLEKGREIIERNLIVTTLVDLGDQIPAPQEPDFAAAEKRMLELEMVRLSETLAKRVSGSNKMPIAAEKPANTPTIEQQMLF